MEVKIKTLTLLWTGGVEAGKCDRIHETGNTVAQSVVAQGEIEPLVGREWRSHNSITRCAGQHVEKFGDLCWILGNVGERSRSFALQGFGNWHLS
jgi:hypothetical protein